MALKDRTQGLLKELRDAVVAFDDEAVKKLSNAVLEEGIDPYDALMNGLAAGMKKVGDLYASREYFLPELMLCADALYAGMDILLPHVKKAGKTGGMQVVIGTVEGDIHDIGKSLVKTMFEAEGWTVHDLGVNVKVERFAEEQQRTNSDVVALSALMTTSMLAIPRIIKMIKERNPKVGVIVGGAPLTQEVAARFGADGYAKTANEAVEETIAMLDRIRSLEAR